MISTKQLFELQSLDLSIEGLRKSIQGIEARLADNQAILAIQAQLEEKRRELQSLKRAQRDVELELATIEDKIQQVDGRLYSGRVGNPKELMGLQEEATAHKASKQRCEERILQMMGEGEEKERQAKDTEARLKGMQTQWEQTRRELESERRQALEALPSLEGRRSVLVTQVSPEELKVYESLRASKGGAAIAKVERGMCTGCRMTLPVYELQRARTAKGPVFCSTCGRILYLS
ncbi:MAG: hypothetical protein HYU29_08650 [Chloroflexi bacterium]|nr:hypothetical protein [Chloroflexota bacterium]